MAQLVRDDIARDIRERERVNSEILDPYQGLLATRPTSGKRDEITVGQRHNKIARHLIDIRCEPRSAAPAHGDLTQGLELREHTVPEFDRVTNELHARVVRPPKDGHRWNLVHGTPQAPPPPRF